jgi:hypothetical protein
MSILKGLLGGIAMMFSLLHLIGPAHSATIGEMAAMQAAMQQHIDRSLVKGALPHFDMKTGKMRQLYPAKAHPMIFSMGDYFVLCSNFRDAGNAVNIDFYLARENGLYVVFQMVVEDRKVLMRKISEGTAKRLN